VAPAGGVTHSPTPDPRAVPAAQNNAEWCDAVCRAHGGDTTFASGLWRNRSASPPLYPNLVTLDRGLSMAALEGALRDLDTLHLTERWGVKDSFAAFDLSARGFDRLLHGLWLWRSPHAPDPGAPDVEWTPILDAVALRAWEGAWRRGAGCVDSDAPIFPPSLLEAPGVQLLALQGPQDFIAGAIANIASGVVGLSNFFSLRADPARSLASLMQHCARRWPHTPLVTYDTDAVASDWIAQGFEAVGPVQVWIRGPRQR
jgi:hypothetical protein